MKTKKPTAIIYNWDREGIITLISDVYFEENLQDEVIVYSLPYNGNVFEDYTKYKPDLIISIGIDLEIHNHFLNKIYIKYCL